MRQNAQIPEIVLFIGFFLAPVWPASARMLSSWFPDSKLNSVFGMISTATYTGGMGGTALAAIVLEYSGMMIFGMIDTATYLEVMGGFAKY